MEMNPPEGGATVARLKASRVGVWALALGVVGFLVWAVLAPLDEGVPSAATVTIDTKRKSVQHLSGGIVRDVLVKEGDVVKEGQVLMRLDEAATLANRVAIRQRYLTFRAMQGRLLAEQAGRDTIAFHPDLQAASADLQIKSVMQTQQQLFTARRAALQADLAAINQSALAQQEQITASEAVLVKRKQQLRLLEEELEKSRPVVAEGYLPRNRLLELERSVADVQAAIAEVMGTVAKAGRSVNELRQRAIARQQQDRKEVESELTDVVREVEGDALKLASVENDLRRTELIAPVAGQVVGLAVQTVGGVIQAGQKVMDVVPLDEPLLLEAKIEPHLIDRVRAGLPTDVRFNAFSHSPQLVVQGVVQSVSSDLLTEQQGGATFSYYLARVQVTPEGMKVLGARRMQPGMPAEVVIKTGERSLLTYLLSPLVKRVAASMTEE
ncbi:HlyD family type I secretion periplasmic adaptor subunit [Aquabacterium sp.]|uniref:HlyD family type I secretion periplasmic adaptor subunit n=1 Tax=Aquabacterium sp. TaxID=1872578 RepID=UPI002630DC04|nr:HlyD family type I secretion periplasmic adaptor subunit [Aquabacterium sp.]MDD2977736.1 HlyD family type I secretion periplasmic adaptor subunit [Aquabacterium sp.]